MIESLNYSLNQSVETHWFREQPNAGDVHLALTQIWSFFVDATETDKLSIKIVYSVYIFCLVNFCRPKYMSVSIICVEEHSCSCNIAKVLRMLTDYLIITFNIIFNIQLIHPEMYLLRDVFAELVSVSNSKSPSYYYCS